MKIRALRMTRSGNVQAYYPPAPEPSPRSSIVLLVHGYNNDEAEAATSYLSMRQSLDMLLKICSVGTPLRALFQAKIWELYWPGYQPLTYSGPSGLKRPGWEPCISALSYSLEVRKARTWVADNLANYLSRCAPLDIFFVAHSLGCRIVLEVLERLSASLLNTVRCIGYLLMAGAVPIDQLQPAGRLGPSARIPYKRYCLHSWRDAVLLGAFPPGQLLAGETPLYGLPVATGLTGWPGSMWSDHADTQLSHGGYWEEGLRRDVGLTTQLCESVFGVAASRMISASPLLSLPSGRALSILPERTLSSARLRGSDWIQSLYG